jgi:hypothetical protein
MEILKQPGFSLTAVCHRGQKTYSLATRLHAAVLVTLLERQLVYLRIPKMQVWLERLAKSYHFNLHEMFKNSGSDIYEKKKQCLLSSITLIRESDAHNIIL